METLIDDDVYDEMKKLNEKYAAASFKHVEEKHNKRTPDVIVVNPSLMIGYLADNTLSLLL